MIVEYAGVVAAISLFAATLSGAFGQNVAAVFASGSAGVSAAASAAKSQKVSPAGARAAFKRAPYEKPGLKYLYALGWIGGTKSRTQCALTMVVQETAKREAEREIRKNKKLVTQLRKRAIGVGTAANALVKGVVSACT